MTTGCAPVTLGSTSRAIEANPKRRLHNDILARPRNRGIVRPKSHNVEGYMRHERSVLGILAAVAAAVTAVAIVDVQPAQGAPVPTPASASGGSQKVIVVLRDQLAATPASKRNMSPRRAEARSAQ